MPQILKRKQNPNHPKYCPATEKTDCMRHRECTAQSGAGKEGGQLGKVSFWPLGP